MVLGYFWPQWLVWGNFTVLTPFLEERSTHTRTMFGVTSTHMNTIWARLNQGVMCRRVGPTWIRDPGGAQLDNISDQIQQGYTDLRTDLRFRAPRGSRKAVRTQHLHSGTSLEGSRVVWGGFETQVRAVYCLSHEQCHITTQNTRYNGGQ